MKQLITSLLLIGSFLPFMAQAQDAAIAPASGEKYQAGKHYKVIPAPVRTANQDKIEVNEVFWYGCPHCYHFEPTINPWVAKLPDDVNFVRVPAMFGGVWDLHGQMFIALQTMGVEAKVHAAVFEAIQKDGKKLASPDEMAEFLATQGVDKDAFLKTYNSFGVKGQVANAKRLGMAYQISGVPAMVVNGKYRFDIGSSGGPEQTLDVADQLIAKERASQ